MVFGLLALIATRGLSHFWPHSVFETTYTGRDGANIVVIGQDIEHEDVAAEQIRATGVAVPDDQNFVKRWLVKTGNRDLRSEQRRVGREKRTTTATQDTII